MKTHFNWLDLLVYRLYFWRWMPIYRGNIELVKLHIKWMQDWVDGQEKEKEMQ